MEQNKNIEQIDQEIERTPEAATVSEGTGKTFTAEDVSRIVADRLKRAKAVSEKEHAQAVAELQSELSQGADAKETDLTKREQLLACREYCIDNGYPVNLLEIIGTENIEGFKTKADMLRNEFAKNHQTPPLKSYEQRNDFDDMKKAFADPKHIPKKF